MMIDFAIEAERGQGKSAGGHPSGGAAALSPHPDDDLAALAAAVPLMLSWGDGPSCAAAGHRDGWWLVLSQLLTLFTTPVIYLWFDRLGQAGCGAGRLKTMNPVLLRWGARSHRHDRAWLCSLAPLGRGLG
jgi:multidrug efflux pump